MAAATSSSSSNTSIFSPDSPPTLALKPHQIKLCSQALEAFTDKLQKPDVINQEFARLQAKRITASDMRRSCSVALDNVNVNKNRYMDVLPFDETRVVLDSCKDYRPSVRGYINASFISTSSSKSLSKFIATQGPLPHTYEDFWEMVFQYKCPAILMLTRLVDNYKMVKCGDYFQAEDGPRDFGNLIVVSKWIKSSNSSLILRHLEVNHKEDLGSERTIRTTRDGRRLYILDDDTSASSISRTSLLSSYFSTSKHDFIKNLKKEVGPPTSQLLAPIQDSEPPRDQGMKNPTEPCINNKMSENDRSDVAVLENVEEENSDNETMVRAETSNNEVEQRHTGKLDEYDPSLDILIAMRKDPVEEVYMTLCLDLKPSLFSRMEVTRSKEDIFMSQRKYTIDLLTKIGSIVDRKSTFGYCILVWGNLVTWRSKKQSVVARSSVEAEYQAMSLGICEQIWLKKVLSDLYQECETPLKLFCNNKIAISIANNPVQHDRTKYVEIDRHFMKERLDSESICISYVPSSQQVSNVHIKGLLRPNFIFCVSKLRLIDIFVPT
ncbi:protein-tyrosine-phosphatase PTP1-like isoform X4 [Cucumis melo var. makuwa]|uniref:Protein-tyrosine-phosphatase PTP1-like isoform X4 n=1 Tax=Cucumis melo var. makuwa TaxID=1194695 RepID=A0A5D3CEC2_CUCMM|nr:protein-tyrosine-phosphatase PTP1-like isoform X4 [Cucumis melo var. makuwa]